MTEDNRKVQIILQIIIYSHKLSLDVVNRARYGMKIFVGVDVQNLVVV